MLWGSWDSDIIKWLNDDQHKLTGLNIIEMIMACDDDVEDDGDDDVELELKQ